MRDHVIPAVGDRNKLNSFELQKLDDEILPTARRWVRDFPALAHHAQQTLAYWGDAQ